MRRRITSSVRVMGALRLNVLASWLLIAGCTLTPDTERADNITMARDLIKSPVSVRQYWAPSQLSGHTPWFLHVGQRILLGTVADSGPAHVLELVNSSLVDLGAPSDSETAIWQIVEVGGCWYGGTHPHAKLVSQGKDLGSLWSGASSAFTLAASNQWIYAGLGPEHSAIAAYDLSSGKVLVHQGQSTAAYGTVHTGKDGVVYALLDGKALRCAQGQIVAVAEAVGPAAVTVPGFIVEGLTVNIQAQSGLELSVQLHNLTTDQSRSVNVSIAGRGLPIYAISSINDQVIGGTILPNEIFSFDGERLKYRGHAGTGEMYSILITEPQRVLMADYPNGNLWIYNPQMPWNLSWHPGGNPTTVPLGKGHLRPMALELGDLGQVWVGSIAGYGLTGGALAMVNLNPINVTNFRQPFTEAGVTALSFDRLTRWLVVVSDKLLLWDVDAGCVAHELGQVPVPWTIQTVDGVLFAVTWTMELTVIDLNSQRVLQQQATSLGLGNSRRNSLQLWNHKLWGIAQAGVYNINLTAGYALSRVASSPVALDVVGRSWNSTRVFVGSGPELWSVSLDTAEFKRVGEPVRSAMVLDFGGKNDTVFGLLKAGGTLCVVALQGLCNS